jgi:hypothetical protein
MDVTKEWLRIPPAANTSTLHGLWLDFLWRREHPESRVCRFKDDIPDWCKEADSGLLALKRAALARRPNGKLHNHQAKQSPYLESWFNNLAEQYNDLLLSESFDQLHMKMQVISFHTKGIGNMAVYDTAVRFGAWLDLDPEMLYLHAGVAMGLHALYEAALMKEDKSGYYSVNLDELPYPLNEGRADLVEDFLCTYRLAIIQMN